MTDDLKTKAGIDTTDFKTGITEMNRDLRVLESGFRANTASMSDWSKDATGLELKMKTLSSAMEIQQQKVAATRAEWERIKAESGEDSRAAQDLEIKLNKETETLGKMGVELRTTEGALEELKSGSNEAGDSVDDLGNQTEETSGKMEGFKSVMSGVGVTVKATLATVLGLLAGVAAVTAMIGGLVFSTASASAELVDLSTKTGISTTALQEMKYIGDQVGVSIDTITGAQARLVRSMNQGRDGTGDQAKAFNDLGISVTDAQGNLRDTQTVFTETLDALNKISNPAERDALAMSLFGKSAQELNPLIKAGSAELERLADKAHEVGAVMSEEDVAAFEAFDDTLASLQAGLKGTLGTLAGAFLPGFQAVFDQVGGYLGQFTDIVSSSNGDFGKIAEGVTGLITQIATDVAAQAPQMLQAGLGIVKSLLDAITTALPSMLTAGIEIIKTLIDFIVQNLPMLIDSGIQIILMLVNAIIQNLPMLIDAGLQAIITLANGLALALPTLIPAIVQAIITIVNTLIENMPMLITAAMALLQGLAEGLIIALPILIAAIPQIIDALLTTLITFLPQLLEMGGKLIATLVGGIVASLPLVVAGIGKLIVIIVENLEKLPAKALEAGKNFINGILDGIETAKGLLFDTITNLVSDMILSIINPLDMHSPSGVGKSIGRNLVWSIPLGGMEVMQQVESAFANMSGRMAQAAAGGIAAAQYAGGNTSTQNDSFQFFAPVIVQGETPSESFGASLKMKRF